MVEIFAGSRKKMELKAAALIAQQLSSAVSNRGVAVFAIPGGRSVSGIFSLLASPSLSVPWGKVHVFMADERIVPLDSELSNFRLARNSFINRLVSSSLLPEENVHPFDISKGPLSDVLSGYASELSNLGGFFDVVLLSSGEDCHVAAIYPEHHSFFDESPMFIYMTDSPKPPPERMSSSRTLISRSSSAFLLFFGESKSDAFARFNDSQLPESSCPAKIVRRIPSSFVFSDNNPAQQFPVLSGASGSSRGGKR